MIIMIIFLSLLKITIRNYIAYSYTSDTRIAVNTNNKYYIAAQEKRKSRKLFLM